MPGTAREAALEAFGRCQRTGAWSAAAIDSVIKKYGLEGRDAALVSRLCLGALQNVQLCNYYINYYYDKNPAGIEPRVREILILGTYQLLFMGRIPPRAAVNESVALCGAVQLDRAAGLVNALLRRIAENRDSLPEIPGKGSPRYLSTCYSHPLWLAKQLTEERGYEFTEAFFAANNRPSGLTVQVNTLKAAEEDYIRAIRRQGIGFRRFESLPGCLELEGGRVADLPGYEEGLFYVQDRAARSAVQISGVAPGMRVLDACSAPGGKAFAAAIAMENRGEIFCWDIHEKKLKLVSDGAERLGIQILRTEQRDARLPDRDLEGRFDLVICDAPCSGFGLLGKKPEIRRKTESELQPLPEIQSRILDNLSAFVRPGGVLLYATCTVLERENAGVVRAFLDRHRDFAPEDFCLGALRSQGGMFSFWPHIHATDGFFVAKLRKSA